VDDIEQIPKVAHTTGGTCHVSRRNARSRRPCGCNLRASV